MTVCSTTALRKYLTQHSNLGQPSREKAVSTTRAHAEGETIINSGRYRRPLFKSSINGEGFLESVRQVLVPARAPGDIVVIDNLSSHKSHPVREAIEAAGGNYPGGWAARLARGGAFGPCPALARHALG